tara:strand:- start:589 stop:1326 length:738 start_codon:yes stop_codon:yes gene_type:complete
VKTIYSKDNMLKKQALEIIGGLSKPSKMPCFGYSIPAEKCNVGGRLRKVEGSICSSCYALKGMYLFKNVKNALQMRYEKLSHALENDSSTFKSAFKTLLEKQSYFRWHDSGDLINESHLKMIVEIALENPHVKFWIPTREFKLVSDYFKTNAKPENLTIRLSATKVDAPAPEKTAKNYSLTVSGVHTKQTNYTSCESKYNTNGKLTKSGKPDTGFCSGTDTRTGKQVDCRKCWNNNEFSISYPIH